MWTAWRARGLVVGREMLVDAKASLGWGPMRCSTGDG